ncbi:MAG: CdaR family protein [Nitrospirota bacterium]
MKFRAILFENWGVKLASLLFAVTLWFYVTSKGKTEMTFTVPLELRNIPRSLAIVGSVPGFINVRLQGQERLLRDITIGKKIAGILDLSLTDSGDHIIHISPDDIKRPSGLAVTNVTPSEIRIKLEPLARKSFRLKPVLHGSPAPGYRVAAIRVVPQKITIEGPASAVAAFDRLQTMPIDLQGSRENISIEPKIDYQGQTVTIPDQQTVVHIIIERVRR